MDTDPLLAAESSAVRVGECRCAIMFTDMCGSTALYEQHGDRVALGVVAEHDRLLLPLVAQHHGHVIKTIGDSIMARFADAPAAVDAAIAMHRALAVRDTTSGLPITIRIGLHYATVLERGADIYGDAVNTAARLEALGGPGAILVSRAVLEGLPPGGYAARPVGPVPLKGKAAPVDVYQVSWSGRFDEYRDPLPGQVTLAVGAGDPFASTASITVLSRERLEYLERAHGVQTVAAPPERLQFLPAERVRQRGGAGRRHVLLYSEDLVRNPSVEKLAGDLGGIFETAELLAADSVVFAAMGTGRGLSRREFVASVLRHYDRHAVRLATSGRAAMATVAVLIHARDAGSRYELSQYTGPCTDARLYPGLSARLTGRPLAEPETAVLAQTLGLASVLAAVRLHRVPEGTAREGQA